MLEEDMTDNTLTKINKICIYNKSDNPNPEYKTEKSAGFDIASNEEVVLPPHKTTVVSTGLYFSLMPGYEAQLRLRSSWGMKGIVMPNAPATIDEDYRGEIKLLLHNLNDNYVVVRKGDRVAQVVCSPVFCPKIYVMDSDEWNSPLNQTIRGEGGFGSTGE